MAFEILTVSLLNRRVREVLQQQFPLFWVTGEISNLTHAGSGHVYFSLKDENAQVRCIMFRNRVQLIPWRLENGQQVEVQALVSLYEARGDFQLNIESLRRAGLGRLYEAYAKLRDQLEMEGLFASARKHSLPRYPRRIGIVTSPQAAALKDILTTLQRRTPQLSAVLYPTPVQGDGAGALIAASIKVANQRAKLDQTDVLIVARGGGSIEDLWAFNEEIVARAIAASDLPVVSGVGHETDTTIADFVADRRASTPTAAAELVSADWFAATQELPQLAAQLQRQFRDALEARMQRLDLLTHRLVHPGKRLEHDRQILSHLATRLNASLARQLKQHAETLAHRRWRLIQRRPSTQFAAARLSMAEQKLASATKRCLEIEHNHLATLKSSLTQLSPLATLERGYSIVRSETGTVVRSSEQIMPGENIELIFAKGWAQGHIQTTDRDTDHCRFPEKGGN